jgi:hypothetical protein
MAMLSKDQVRAVPRTDLPAQRAFVHQVFGVARPDQSRAVRQRAYSRPTQQILRPVIRRP